MKHCMPKPEIPIFQHLRMRVKNYRMAGLACFGLKMSELAPRPAKFMFFSLLMTQVLS